MVVGRSGFRELLSRSFDPHLTEKEIIESNSAISPEVIQNYEVVFFSVNVASVIRYMLVSIFHHIS